MKIIGKEYRTDEQGTLNIEVQILLYLMFLVRYASVLFLVAQFQNP